MQDLVAPLYGRLLVEAAQRLGPSEAFYQLWPCHVPPAPWDTVVTRLFEEVQLSHASLHAGLQPRLHVHPACI